MTDRPVSAIILAAGKGTRMRSELPKVLHPLLGSPMLSYPIQAATALSANPVVVVVGFGAEQVKAAFPQPHLRFVIQSEQLGTGHAALQARPVLADFPGDVFILPGDAPLIQGETLKAFLAFHRTEQADLTVLTTQLLEPAHYGRIVRSPDGALQKIVEAKDADAETLAIQEINSGIYLVSSRFLFEALLGLSNDNAQGEYYLTDIVAIARAEGKTLRAWLHTPAEELGGVNDRVELAGAEDLLRKSIAQRFMRAGVTLEHPTSIRIEPGTVIEPDVSIGSGVQLRGRCRVGRGTRIEPGCVLTDVQMGSGSHIGANSVLTGIELEPYSRVPAMTTRVAQGRR